MSVQVQIIGGERCDHCNVMSEEHVFAFKFYSKEQGRQQIWLHRRCLALLATKAEKLEAKAKKEESERDRQ